MMPWTGRDKNELMGSRLGDRTRERNPRKRCIRSRLGFETNGATLRAMNIASTRFSSSFGAGAVLWLASQLSAADRPGAASQSTVVKPNELVLAEPAAVTKKAVVAWKTDGLTGMVAVLDERFSAKTYQSSAKAARGSGLDLYYWIEVGRNPKLAEEHPEWMASLGMHTDWLKRFPHAKTPGAGEVAKAFPWVSINYREAFDAHLARIDRCSNSFRRIIAGFC